MTTLYVLLILLAVVGIANAIVWRAPPPKKPLVDAPSPPPFLGVQGMLMARDAALRDAGLSHADVRRLTAGFPLGASAPEPLTLTDQGNQAMNAEPRFFIDHGLVHDRKTGRHVRGCDCYDDMTADELLALLHELEAASPPPAGPLTDASDASPSQLATPAPQPTQPEEAGSATP
jgi:hypothetical protein